MPNTLAQDVRSGKIKNVFDYIDSYRAQQARSTEQAQPCVKGKPPEVVAEPLTKKEPVSCTKKIP